MTTLSVLCPTRDPGPRVRALLEPLRAVADEIVIAADSRLTDGETLAQYAAIADRVLRFEVGPTHSSLAWLHRQCRGDWILLLAGDEVCGPELVAALPELIAARDAVQVSFSLRWLWPDAGRWLCGPPWHPDFHTRLVRNDGTLRFLGVTHELAREAFPRRYADLPLWHLSLIVADRAQRAAKAARNEASRPGLLAPGGRELNATFYLPEDAPDAALVLAGVPAADTAAIRRVLDASFEPTAAGAPELPVAGTRAQIEPLWAGRPLSARAFAATLTPLSVQPLQLRPGEQRTIFVRVRNDGDARWPWGLDQPPYFRAGFRWHGGPRGATPSPEGRAAFPCEIPPGGERIVPAHVTAPSAPGDWELELDVLLEDVRWFGAGCLIAARVHP